MALVDSQFDHFGTQPRRVHTLEKKNVLRCWNNIFPSRHVKCIVIVYLFLLSGRGHDISVTDRVGS